MKLYHGSDTKVETPRILAPLRALDFGAGFYTTSDKEQALKWANSVCRRKKAGVPVLNTYQLDDIVFEDLRIMKFDEANGDWLDFVANNRLNKYSGDIYDIVIGPVANR